MTTTEKETEEIKTMRLCPKCYSLSRVGGYCSCGGFKRLSFNDLEENEKKMFYQGYHLAQEQAVREYKKDKERLDFLDRCNRALNKHYGTNYGWKLILNHNVTRLMSERGIDAIDLNDAEGGNVKSESCREAIDKQMDLLTPPTKE